MTTPTVGNSAAATYVATGSTTTAGITTVAGGTPYAFVIIDGDRTSTGALTDSKGNTWVKDYEVLWATGNYAPGAYLQVWRCTGTSRGTSHTFTITAANGYSSLIVVDVIPAAGETLTADIAIGSNTDSATPYVRSGTTGQANALVLSFFGPESNSVVAVAASGFTSLPTATAAGAWQIAAAYQAKAAAGAVSASWTGTGIDFPTNPQIIGLFSLYGAGGGGGGISPTGIASAEAMGAPGLSATVVPAGVASAEALGVASVAAAIAPVGIASAQAMGAPSISGSVSPSGIASAQALGAPSVGAGITTAGIATGEAFGVPIVAGAGLFPVGIASAEAIGQPALAARVAPGGIASGEAFGVPTLGTPAAPGFPGFEVDQRPPRRLQERSVKPMLVRAVERRLPKVAPQKERAAKRAKVIEFEAAAALLDGATARDIAPLLQQWEAQRPYIPPKLKAVPTLDLFLSNVAFRVEQAQASKAAHEALQRARRQDEDALIAILLA